MKKMKFPLLSTYLFLFLFVGLSVTMISCDSEEELGDIPSITLSSSNTANSIGSVVSTKLTVTAPEGLVSITVLKNGAPFATEAIANNPKSLEWDFEYTVDSQIGSTVNFSFQAVDGADRSSALALFAVLVSAKPIKEIAAGNYIGVHNWSADTIYRLNGFVRIGKDEQIEGGGFTNQVGTLNIEEGTLIIGDKQTKATLVVQRGSKINAIGTKEAPIVMTSEQPVGLRLPGDWGGLVLCGRVKITRGKTSN